MESGVPELGSHFKELMEQTSFDIENNDELSVKEILQKSADFVHSLLNNPSAYKENRIKVQEDFQLTSNSGNWDTGVIDKIDEHLKSIGKSDGFLKLVENSFDDKSKMNRFSFFTLAYQYLNLVGYKADEIKNSGIKNHLQDATHAFYAGHCDFFISMDKKLTAKSKAIYEKFNIQTKIIHPSDLLNELETNLLKNGIEEVLTSAFKNMPIDSLIEDGIQKSLYRLDNYFLDYFTHTQTERNTIIFSKLQTNYSNFLFYEEHDTLIRNFNDYFGVELDSNSIIEKFKSNIKEERFVQYFLGDVYIKLLCDGRQFYLFINLPTIS